MGISLTGPEINTLITVLQYENIKNWFYKVVKEEEQV